MAGRGALGGYHRGVAREELSGPRAARLGEIANEVVACLEVLAGTLGGAGLGPLDGMPAVAVPRSDGGPEIVAHFGRGPYDAEDPDGFGHAGELRRRVEWLARREVPFDAFLLCIGSELGLPLACHRIAFAPGMESVWHAVSHGGGSWIEAPVAGRNRLAVPEPVAVAFARAYGGPPGWRSEQSYLG